MEKDLYFLIDVFEFLSFWMVAPEFLGAQRMHKIEKQVMKLELAMPGLVFGLSGVVFGLFFSIMGNRLKEFPFWNWIVFGFMGVYFLSLLIFQNRIRNYLANKVFGPFFRELSDSGIFRQRFLKAGVFLFTFSFILKALLYLFL